MALSRHARRHPVTGPVAMKETHIPFGGEVANYTERVDRYIGETTRNLVNAPGARRRDWPDYVKYIEFVYNRKYIPGTNLGPYMATMGRQPFTPIDTAYVDVGFPSVLCQVAQRRFR